MGWPQMFGWIVFLACSLCAAQVQGTPSLIIEPHEINFGPHDIGTTTVRTLLVKNISTASVSVTLTMSGSNASDFTWVSTCLSNLPPNYPCEVLLSFSPLTITQANDRQARLAVSNGNVALSPVTLSGYAFQNLGVSSGTLTFGEQLVNTLSAPRSLVVTNYSESSVGSLAVTTAGDFTENHSKCDKIAPGASCAISVVFAPKVLGTTKGSFTITADQSGLGGMPRVVLLDGNAVNRCKTEAFSLWSWSVWLTVLTGGLYLTGLILVRWHMIAKPARAQVIAEIKAVQSRLIAETAGLPKSAELDGRVARILYLLDWALYPFKNKRFPLDRNEDGSEKSLVPGWLPWYTRLFNALFWPRGQELAGWSCSHEAELLLVELLSPEHVRARMETAEQELRVLNTSVGLALADRLREAVGPAASLPPVERQRALLAEALSLLYAQGDTDYFQLAAWHSKMIWLAICALLFTFALAATLGNATLLLLGAVGGLLSRLARTVQAAEVTNDYGASWGALFLSPLSGALSAWGGILLIVLGLKFNILGSALNVDWCNPYDPATLAIALLLGFSERLFDGVVSQIEEKFVKAPAAPTTPPSKPVPIINSLDPPAAVLGKLVSFTVKGSNFLPGATAMVTDDNGNPMSAKLEFKDAATVLVTTTLTGGKSYTSTLTITNPDKQAATVKFAVAIS
jgi:hypothetical protein